MFGSQDSATPSAGRPCLRSWWISKVLSAVQHREGRVLLANVKLVTGTGLTTALHLGAILDASEVQHNCRDHSLFPVPFPTGVLGLIYSVEDKFQPSSPICSSWEEGQGIFFYSWTVLPRRSKTPECNTTSSAQVCGWEQSCETIPAPFPIPSSEGDKLLMLASGECSTYQGKWIFGLLIFLRLLVY